MMRLYLDIETLPSHDPAVHERIAQTITPPGNISKADTIAAWNAEKKPALVEEAMAKTALDGATGHICCLSAAINDDPPVYWEARKIEDERRVIEGFAGGLDGHAQGYPVITVIGHNVIGFDIRFLWQRAFALGIKMPAWFPRDPKPWDGSVLDTMIAFAGHRGSISLDRLCLALGLPGKDGVDGSMVADMWRAGRFAEIAAYCRADVERVRNVHRKMQVAFGEAA